MVLVMALLLAFVPCSCMAVDLRSVTAYGFRPRVIVDGGANTGDWSREVRTIFPDAKLVMIEAQADLEVVLNDWAKLDGNAVVVSCALSSRPGIVSFFTAGKGATGASIFKENTHYYADAKPVMVTTRTLDEILTSLGLLEFVDLIKLDVQGAELSALVGAGEALKRATFVTAEVSTVAYNSGEAACWFEVDAFLRENGYYMHDIIELHRGLPQNLHGLGQVSNF